MRINYFIVVYSESETADNDELPAKVVKLKSTGWWDSYLENVLLYRYFTKYSVESVCLCLKKNYIK